MHTDSYLDLAESVLKLAMRPMTPQEILHRAYVGGLVPRHLHGKTQHKTLTARLSIDILKFKERSKFFRPWPGRFFLSEFIQDETLPREFRTPIVAQRRSRQLRKDYAAFICRGLVPRFRLEELLAPKVFGEYFRDDLISYQNDGRVDKSDYGLWTLAVVRRGRHILTYKRGVFVDGRHRFRERRTASFCAPLTQNDRSLFDRRYHGALASSISTVAVDLDLEYSKAFQEIERSSRLSGGFFSELEGGNYGVLVSTVRLPSDYGVFTRRLAITDLQWMLLPDFFDREEEFDLWSRRAARLSVRRPAS